MPKILAVDPGKMTGVATWDDGEFGSDAWSQEIFYAGIETGIKWADEVVSESFIITNATLTKSRGDNWSLEFIGVMRYLCWTHKKTLTLQSPAEAKSFATNDKLKSADWFKKGVDHPNDAARHLMVYLLKKRHATPKTLQLV